MPQPKTFDRADLLRFFVETGEDALAGGFTVIQPSPTLFGETETKTYDVYAGTVAYHCERYGLTIVEQRASASGGGHKHLPEDHPLRRLCDEGARLFVQRGGTSAYLARWVTGMADQFRAEVAALVPHAPLDLTDGAIGVVVADLGGNRYRVAPFTLPADGDDSDEAQEEDAADGAENDGADTHGDGETLDEFLDDLLNGQGDNDEPKGD